MPELLFTPTSITLLTQFILLLCCCIYLGRLLWTNGPNPARVGLFAYFAFSGSYVAFNFFSSSSYQSWNLYLLYPLPLIGGFMLLAALYYAYHFPKLNSGWIWEFRLSMAYCAILILVELGTLAYRFENLLIESRVIWRGEHVDNFWVLGYSWVVIVFFRQAGWHEKVQQEVTSESRGRGVSLRLKSRRARLARNTGLAFSFLIFLSSLDTAWNSMSLDWVQRAAPLISIWTIWLLLTFYMDQQEGFTPIRFKILMFFMALILCVFNIAGWVTASLEMKRFSSRQPGQNSYSPSRILGYQTLSWAPEHHHGSRGTDPDDVAYTVHRSPFSLEYEWGSKVLGFLSNDQSSEKPPVWSEDSAIQLPFQFEFFGKKYDEIYVSSLGFVSFGKAVREPDIRHQYGSAPMIIPLFEEIGVKGMSPRTGMYILSNSDLFRVTWCELHDLGVPGNGFTFQLTLQPGGTFEMTYGFVAHRENLGISPNPWPYSLLAVLPGSAAHSMALTPAESRIGFSEMNTTTVVPWRGIAHDSYLAARRHLSPLMYWEICTVLVLFGALVLAISTLVRLVFETPLENLSRAVQLVDAGNLNTQARIFYRDELGYIAASFNALVKEANTVENELTQKRSTLEHEVDRRTESLMIEAKNRDEVARELEEGERALTAIMSNLPGVVFRMKAVWDGPVEFISHQAVGLFEEPNSGHLNINGIRGKIHPDDLREAFQIWDNARQKFSDYQLNYRIQTYQNEDKWIREQGRFQDEHGVTYCDGLLLDMSEAKRVEQDLKKARIEAEAADRAKSAFVANMSHEIRTPLNSILGYAQILCQSEQLSDRHRKMSKKIKNSGSDLLVFINDILDLAKIEAGRMELNPGEFDLVSTLEGLGERFGARSSSEGLQWKFDCELKDSHWVMGDEQKLVQTLSHLLSLSIRRSKFGRIVFKVVYEGAGLWFFTIEDTGTISKEAEEASSEKFLFNANKAPIGNKNELLSIGVCRRLVELMDGSFRIRQVDGNGTLTQVRIPLPSSSSGNMSLNRNSAEGNPQQLHSDKDTLDGSSLFIDQNDPNEWFLFTLERLEISESLRERLLDAVQSGAVTLIEELLNELEGEEKDSMVVAEGMRNAIRKYDMKLLENYIHRIGSGARSAESGDSDQK